jgi:hypothetical protein
MINKPLKQLLTVKDLARQFQITEGTIRKWANSRKKCYDRSLVANAAGHSQDNDDAFDKWVDELIEEAEENDIKRAEKKYNVDLSDAD